MVAAGADWLAVRRVMKAACAAIVTTRLRFRFPTIGRRCKAFGPAWAIHDDDNPTNARTPCAACAFQTELEPDPPQSADGVRTHSVHDIGAHLMYHALGPISLDMAEEGMGIATEVWYSMTGMVLLYGAAMTHFVLALWAVYERRTFRLPIWNSSGSRSVFRSRSS